VRATTSRLGEVPVVERTRIVESALPVCTSGASGSLCCLESADGHDEGLEKIRCLPGCF
jgi:hypothetical protein